MADNTQTWTRLRSGSASFDQMLNGFGVVTVMNADVYSLQSLGLLGATDIDYQTAEAKSAKEWLDTIEKQPKLCSLKTLKVANATMDGPTKTVTGGQFNRPLIKFGKTARLEMQDALGDANALEVFNGIVTEHFATAATEEDYKSDGASHILHVTDQFHGPVAIVGDTFFIDQETGTQVPVKILFYDFYPESMFNLTQDAEGDATVFDLNGDLYEVPVLVHNQPSQVPHRKLGYGGVANAANVFVYDFYSILPGSGSITGTGTVLASTPSSDRGARPEEEE